MYCFGSIPRIFWWAIVTMTTVGFGDCYPVSTGGKLLSMMTMVLGVLILALPITVIGSNFQKMVEMHEEENSLLREFDVSEDGCIDEVELRAFIASKRKDNVLRKDVDLHPGRLITKYAESDESIRKNCLSFEEFQFLKRDIIDPSTVDTQANIRSILKRISDHEQSFRSLQQQLNRMEQLICQQAGQTPPAFASPRPPSNGNLTTPLPPVSVSSITEPQEPVPPADLQSDPLSDSPPVHSRIQNLQSGAS